ncbi:MAG: DUF4249 domain-containing protein [Hymenobacter sp.]|nr:MAG: DUF4249 domain-containing protein [Hymenobacter sp.]
MVRWGARLLFLGLAGCVESYLPAVIDAPNSYLVVDGFINGNGVTRIKLSRSINLAVGTTPPAETKATVYIVDDVGARYAVRETSTGFYKSDSVVLNPARQYQLRIATTGAKAASYESELVPLKVTPAIDKLDWAWQGDYVGIRLNTHDPQQQSRYYRWSFLETWEFTSAYESVLEYRGGIIQSRITPIHTCWRTEQNTIIKQGSTAQLAQDIVVNQPLLAISNRAERIKIRYSVLASQYAETAPEFAYNELLRKNTEAVGTVNDPLPTQLTGNVHRIDNASEPVLGFVSAHTVQYKRLFINRADLNLPGSWRFDSPYATCTTTIELAPDPSEPQPIYIPYTRVFATSDNVPIEYYVDNGMYLGYTGSSRACVDCRVRGVNAKPGYW